MTQIVSILAHSTHTAETYHTRDCRVSPGNTNEITKAEAERRGLEKCKVCSNDAKQYNGDAWKYHKQLGVVGND